MDPTTTFTALDVLSTKALVCPDSSMLKFECAQGKPGRPTERGEVDYSSTKISCPPIHSPQKLVSVSAGLLVGSASEKPHFEDGLLGAVH